MINNFTPSVVAPLEEWDDTTDVIVWLIENNQAYHLSIPELSLEQFPEQKYNSRHFENLESQSADLEGWTEDHEKVRFTFDVEQKSVVDPETGNEVEGFEVTVKKRSLRNLLAKQQKFASYIIAGCDRKEFAVISQKIEA